MKRKGLIILLLILILTGGIVMFTGLFGRRKSKSLEQIRKMDPKYENLVGVSHFSGGGMLGERYYTSLEKDKEGNLIYRVEESPEHSYPTLVHEYKLPDDRLLEELDSIVREYNMSRWDEFPETGIEVLDAPSTDTTLYFLPEGEKYRKSVRIDYDKDMPDGAYQVLKQLLNSAGTAAKAEYLSDTYLTDWNDDRKVRSGREIENSEEDIDLLVSGYWEGDESDSLDSYNGQELRTHFISDNSEYIDYEVKETVMEPLDDYDSSWYRIFTSEGRELILTATLETMYVIQNGEVKQLNRYK